MGLHNYEQGIRSAKKGIEKANISKKNKKMILNFTDYLITQGLSKSRVIRYYSTLKQLAKDLGKDFDKATEQDIASVVSKIQQSNYAEWTKYTYKVMIKRFYKWVVYKDKCEEYPTIVKWIKVTMNKGKLRLPNEGDLLTEDDLMKLIDSCKHIRDKAFVSLLWESGARVGEIGNMKIKNIVFDQYGSKLTLFGKTGSRKIRVINATSHLATWLDVHPDKHNPEANVWVSIGTMNYGKPMAYGTIRLLLIRLFERAGIRKRFNPHLFRHSRATVMSKYLTEFQMNQYFGWVQGSNMPATYVHMSGRDVDDAILKMNNLKVSEEDKKPEMNPITCPRCEIINAYGNKFCTKCGCLLDEKEQFKMEELAERKENANKLMEKLLQDKDIQSLISEKLKGFGVGSI